MGALRLGRGQPVQRLLAVATDHGVIHLFGQHGAARTWSHPEVEDVQQLIFVVNEGLLIAICPPSTIHVWNIAVPEPLLAQTVTLKRER